MIKVAVLQDSFEFGESLTHKPAPRPVHPELYLHVPQYEVVREVIHDYVMARFWAGGS